MNRKTVSLILKRLQNRGRCYNMDIFINSSVLLSAHGNKQYFTVDNAIHEKCLVLHLIYDDYTVADCTVATAMENNIETIDIYVREE